MSTNITKLSSKGQVFIPKPLRSAHHWETGQELVIVDLGDGVLLKPKNPFDETDIAEVASCLKYKGNTKKLFQFLLLRMSLFQTLLLWKLNGF